MAGAVWAGIEIPRDDCEWRAGDEGNMANRCDGDQIAVGACGGGFNNDCPGSADTALSLQWCYSATCKYPGGEFTLVECCRVPEFYYGTCESHGGTWGELLECPAIHSGSGHLVEGFCESGTSTACNGHASEVECCQGHYQGQLVGSTGQCTWLFSGGFGATIGEAAQILWVEADLLLQSAAAMTRP